MNYNIFILVTNIIFRNNLKTKIYLTIYLFQCINILVIFQLIRCYLAVIWFFVFWIWWVASWHFNREICSSLKLFSPNSFLFPAAVEGKKMCCHPSRNLRLRTGWIKYKNIFLTRICNFISLLLFNYRSNIIFIFYFL